MFEIIATWSHQFLDKGDMKQVEKNLSLKVPQPSRKLPSSTILSSLIKTKTDQKTEQYLNIQHVLWLHYTALKAFFPNCLYFKTTFISLLHKINPFFLKRLFLVMAQIVSSKKITISKEVHHNQRWTRISIISICFRIPKIWNTYFLPHSGSKISLGSQCSI